jgi:AcrR family transcriptional regulator
MKDIENIKYKDILKTSRELFFKHGFRRVSVEEICRKANVSKVTFYRFFDNKIELAKAVLDNEFTNGKIKFRELMNADLPPSEKIKGLLKMKFEGTNDISREFLQDFYMDPGSELTKYVEERTRMVWKEYIKDFKKAQKDGWIRKDLKIEFLILFSQKMGGLVNDEELLKLYKNPQELIMEFTKFFTYGITERE